MKSLFLLFIVFSTVSKVANGADLMSADEICQRILAGDLIKLNERVFNPSLQKDDLSHRTDVLPKMQKGWGWQLIASVPQIKDYRWLYRDNTEGDDYGIYSVCGNHGGVCSADSGKSEAYLHYKFFLKRLAATSRFELEYSVVDLEHYKKMVSDISRKALEMGSNLRVEFQSANINAENTGGTSGLLAITVRELDTESAHAFLSFLFDKFKPEVDPSVVGTGSDKVDDGEPTHNEYGD